MFGRNISCEVLQLGQRQNALKYSKKGGQYPGSAFGYVFTTKWSDAKPCRQLSGYKEANSAGPSRWYSIATNIFVLTAGGLWLIALHSRFTCCLFHCVLQRSCRASTSVVSLNSKHQAQTRAILLSNVHSAEIVGERCVGAS